MNNLYLICFVATEKVSGINKSSLLRHTVMLHCFRQLLLYENTALTPQPALNFHHLPIHTSISLIYQQLTASRIIYTSWNSCICSIEWLLKYTEELKTGFDTQFPSKWLINMKLDSFVPYSVPLNSSLEACTCICIHTFHLHPPFITSSHRIILSQLLFASSTFS